MTLFICISSVNKIDAQISINNGLTNRGWSACGATIQNGGSSSPHFSEIAMQQPKYKTLYFTLVNCSMARVIKILQFNELEFSITHRYQKRIVLKLPANTCRGNCRRPPGPGG